LLSLWLSSAHVFAHSYQQGAKGLDLLWLETLHCRCLNSFNDLLNLPKGRFRSRGEADDFGTPVCWIGLALDKAATFQPIEKAHEGHGLNIHAGRQGGLTRGGAESNMGQGSGLPGRQPETGTLKCPLKPEAQETRGIHQSETNRLIGIISKHALLSQRLAMPATPLRVTFGSAPPSGSLV
jgi:hypothetical protein